MLMLDTRWANGVRPFVLFHDGIVICPQMKDLKSEKEQTMWLAYYNRNWSTKATWKEIPVKGKKIKVVAVDGSVDEFLKEFSGKAIYSKDKTEIKEILLGVKTVGDELTEEEKAYVESHKSVIEGAGEDTPMETEEKDVDDDEEDEDDDEDEDEEEEKDEKEDEKPTKTEPSKSTSALTDRITKMISDVTHPDPGPETAAVKKLSIDIVSEVWKEISNILK